MASNTKNVKLGVCRVVYKGVDLGYTSGGVEVTVKTDTHKVMVDQFGKTPINEYLMGRDVAAVVPLAEATIDNMVAIMPGATMNQNGGAVASGSVTIATVPAAGDTIVLNGTTVTFRSVLTNIGVEVLIGATAAATATALGAVLNSSTDKGIASASYSVAGAIVSITYGNQLVYGTTGMKAAEGNNYALNVGTAGIKVTLSGPTLTGGLDTTSKTVMVTTGVGTNLLDTAAELRLHPSARADSDRTEDFVIPLAATAGALKFAYKLEQERVYDVTFEGYPDPVTNKLFTLGM
jgi:hypothetical protein